MALQNRNKVVINGNPRSYSFTESRLYYACRTGTSADGNVVVKTETPLLFGNVEYDKFSVQETSLFNPQQIIEEVVILTGCVNVRLVDRIDPVIKNVRQSYLNRSKCRVKTVEISHSGFPGQKRVVCQLLSYSHEDHIFCPVCHVIQKCGKVCGRCENKAKRIVRVYKVHETGKKSYFGSFPSGDCARRSIEAFCRLKQLEKGSRLADVTRAEVNLFKENGWSFEYLPTHSGEPAMR